MEQQEGLLLLKFLYKAGRAIEGRKKAREVPKKSSLLWLFRLPLDALFA
jgi:hypothetical protein